MSKNSKIRKGTKVAPPEARPVETPPSAPHADGSLVPAVVGDWNMDGMSPTKNQRVRETNVSPESLAATIHATPQSEMLTHLGRLVLIVMGATLSHLSSLAEIMEAVRKGLASLEVADGNTRWNAILRNRGEHGIRATVKGTTLDDKGRERVVSFEKDYSVVPVSVYVNPSEKQAWDLRLAEVGNRKGLGRVDYYFTIFGLFDTYGVDRAHGERFYHGLLSGNPNLGGFVKSVWGESVFGGKAKSSHPFRNPEQVYQTPERTWRGPMIQRTAFLLGSKRVEKGGIANDAGTALTLLNAWLSDVKRCPSLLKSDALAEIMDKCPDSTFAVAFTKARQDYDNPDNKRGRGAGKGAFNGKDLATASESATSELERFFLAIVKRDVVGVNMHSDLRKLISDAEKIASAADKGFAARLKSYRDRVTAEIAASTEAAKREAAEQKAAAEKADASEE